MQYHALNMILNVHSDTLYLSEPKVWSCAAGHFSLDSYLNKIPNQTQ